MSDLDGQSGSNNKVRMGNREGGGEGDLGTHCLSLDGNLM